MVLLKYRGRTVGAIHYNWSTIVPRKGETVTLKNRKHKYEVINVEHVVDRYGNATVLVHLRVIK